MPYVKRHELAVYLKTLLLGTSMLSRVKKNSSGFILDSKRSGNKLRQIAQNNRDIVVVRQASVQVALLSKQLVYGFSEEVYCQKVCKLTSCHTKLPLSASFTYIAILI